MQTVVSPSVVVSRITPIAHHGFAVPDPFAPRQRPGASFFNALLATALFRCWHLLIFFGAWSTLITILNHQGHKLVIQSTLLTVVGTVLGFVVSYRTTSSFERYNEGRRYWSSIILASRTFARTVWFHVPDAPPTKEWTAEQQRARTTIEKKTVINLVEAFGVAVKHYLRGEDGIYYKDLYYLVKFLPAYALPPGIPSTTNLATDGLQAGPSSPRSPSASRHRPSNSVGGADSFLVQRTSISPRSASASAPHLPLPATAAPVSEKPFFLKPIRSEALSDVFSEKSVRDYASAGGRDNKVILPQADETYLLPAWGPPKYHLFDLFPFSLLVKVLTNKGRELKGKKAAKLRAKMRNKAISHNLPLEISLYLSSYIASLQRAKATDVPTINGLLAALNMLVDSLTGLERILTTPIPFSYSIHLWVVTIIYCLALPIQIWTTLHWVTIPGTVIISFMFFGFLVAGEEIENPFGYDQNDLNLDHFTHNIIRNELLAITSTPPPDPADWAFAPENDLLFSSPAALDNYISAERVTPQEWLRRGYPDMQRAMSKI